MDINRLNNNINNGFNKTEESGKSEKADISFKKSPEENPAHKVSLTDYKFRKNDQLFAKIELGKLEEASSQKLAELKTKIDDYQNAKAESEEAARQTEIGKQLNDPEVWGEIARKMLR